jgi:hypothetical protein
MGSKSRLLVFVFIPVSMLVASNIRLLFPAPVYEREDTHGIIGSTESTSVSSEDTLGDTGSSESEAISLEYTRGIIGSPESTTISFGDCRCALLSIDCLDAIRCLQDPDTRLKQVHAGIVKRQALRKMATYWNEDLVDDYSWAPLGKALQSVSIKLWQEWLIRNKLPKGIDSRPDAFVNETFYPFCVKKQLQGRACFLSEFGAAEQQGDLEKAAIKRHGRGDRAELASARKELQLMRRNPYDMSPYSYLVGFSHMSRITLNIRRFLIEMYEERVRSIDAKEAGSNVLRVAMHIRRGDSCEHKLTGYSTTASPLDSKPQMSGVRLCYDTSVYIQALMRVRALAGDRHIVVYIATDHLTSLMDEIKERYRDLYDELTWKYVDHSRNIFNYSTTEDDQRYIEFAGNTAQLGETAVLDIWHLSHGEVFVGHLGSRFGKLSWWQATARHNSFVPFFTVDGHSMCCDIDESCGYVSPAVVSMENCLVYSRDDSPFVQDPVKYWAEGSTVRFEAAKAEVRHRLTKNRYYQVPPLLALTLNNITGGL